MAWPRRPGRKYGNRKVTLDGLVFDSQREAQHYQALKTLEQLGEIQDLQCQVPFRLAVNGEHVCAYVADFAFVDTATGEYHTVDVKGFKTPVYRLKAKLFRACYGFAIEEQ